MSTSNAIAQGLYSKLAAGTALTALLGSGTASIYGMTAPDNATTPYLVYNVQGGGARNDNPHDTRDVVYTIRAFGASLRAAGSVDLQVSTLLHRGSLSVSGYTFVTCRRETEIELVEDAPNGQSYFLVGAMYRIILDT